MTFHRLALAALVLLVAGCADDEVAAPAPAASDSTMTSVAPAAPSTTAATSTTTGTTASEVVTSTTAPASPPVTKPLTTAPPSPLLDEVVAAYDAAYADLLAATLAGDPSWPTLGDHMSVGQAEVWRTAIRALRADGTSVRMTETGRPPKRVEGFVQLTDAKVQLNVCRFPNEASVLADGTVEEPGARPYRYLETLEMGEGGWKWSGREWIDPSPDYSDCSPA